MIQRNMMYPKIDKKNKEYAKTGVQDEYDEGEADVIKKALESSNFKERRYQSYF